jgi:hypothetical protein
VGDLGFGDGGWRMEWTEEMEVGVGCAKSLLRVGSWALEVGQKTELLHLIISRSPIDLINHFNILIVVIVILFASFYSHYIFTLLFDKRLII